MSGKDEWDELLDMFIYTVISVAIVVLFLVIAVQVST